MELKPIRTDDQPVPRGTNYEAAQDVAVAQQGQKVLRNTYMLLALTMVPTVIGAFVGMATGGIILANPIISTLVMLVAVVGLPYGPPGNRQHGGGVALPPPLTGALRPALRPPVKLPLALPKSTPL